MRLNRLALYVFSGVFAVVLLAMCAVGAALYTAVKIRHLLETTGSREMLALFVEEETALALMEQRGLVMTYLLDDGDPHWLEELEKRRARLNEVLQRAQQVSASGREAEYLDRLEVKYQEYDRQRREAIRLYQTGDVREAARIATEDLTRLFRETAEQSRLLIEAGQKSLQQADEQAEKSVGNTAMYAAGAIAMILALSGLILFLLYAQLIRPIRLLVAEASAHPDSFWDRSSDDEIRSIGRYIRSLMGDVAAARSDLVRKNARLLHAEKLASVGKLASSVAHEIKNPLTAMKMWLFSIKKSVTATPDLDRKFEIVSGEIARLEGIINNFLTFSRPPAAQIAPLRVSKLLDDTLQLIQPQCDERGVTVETHIRDELPVVQGDFAQLKQVLVNLLLNAVEAGDAGTLIQVSAESEIRPGHCKTVVIRIQDHGRGIPKELQERIFEPFFTTRENGTGLGLCIASQILLNHGGWLELERSDDHGSTFAVWIPTEAVATHEHSSHS